MIPAASEFKQGNTCRVEAEQQRDRNATHMMAKDSQIHNRYFGEKEDRLPPKALGDEASCRWHWGVKEKMLLQPRGE